MTSVWFLNLDPCGHTAAGLFFCLLFHWLVGPFFFQSSTDTSCASPNVESLLLTAQVRVTQAPQPTAGSQLESCPASLWMMSPERIGWRLPVQPTLPWDHLLSSCRSGGEVRGRTQSPQPRLFSTPPRASLKAPAQCPGPRPVIHTPWLCLLLWSSQHSLLREQLCHLLSSAQEHPPCSAKATSRVQRGKQGLLLYTDRLRMRDSRGLRACL